MAALRSTRAAAPASNRHTLAPARPAQLRHSLPRNQQAPYLAPAQPQVRRRLEASLPAAASSSAPSPVAASAAQPQQASEAQLAPWRALSGTRVLRSSDGAELALTSLWGPTERAVVVFTRSFGCPFCWELAIQLRRDVKPALDAAGVKLLLVSIGTLERSVDFAAVTQFPRNCLFADPTSSTYAALGLVKGIRQTFFDIKTPLSLLKRAATGRMADLQDVLRRWHVWAVPQPDQAWQQGGMYVFAGEACVWSVQDPATGVHADLDELLGVATRSSLGSVAGAVGGDCGCE